MASNHFKGSWTKEDADAKKKCASKYACKNDKTKQCTNQCGDCEWIFTQENANFDDCVSGDVLMVYDTAPYDTAPYDFKSIMHYGFDLYEQKPKIIHFLLFFLL